MDSNILLLASDLPLAPDWRCLGEHLPYDWIEDALAYTGNASIRKRRLPAQQVVWLVIAMALYRHRSIRQVVAELDLALPDLADRCVTDSAVTQARQRLGAKPLEWLFETSSRAWRAQDEHRYQFKGLQLLAMDGTTLKLADSTENRAHFGSPAYAKGSVASYPHARMVTLSALCTQQILAASFGPYTNNEMVYAKQLLKDIPDHSLTVLDRGFLSAEFLCNLSKDGQQRHFLVPAKVNTSWKIIEGDEDDALVEMIVSAPARRNDATLPRKWRARAIRRDAPDGKSHYLLTSLIDRRAYPAAEMRDCYLQRWQIETSYRELKQSMMGMALSLRSQSLEGTNQEIWGILIAYNLVRLEMARAAEQAKCEPIEISFVLALATFQVEMMHASALLARGNLPGVIKRMRDRMIVELNIYRPNRKFQRVMKARPQRYPERRLKKTNAQ